MAFIVKVLPLLLLLSFFLSCSTISYIVEQGMGQLSLQQKARANSDVLNDPRVAKESKDKIALIEKYRKYFFSYFKTPETKIYTRTTMLDGPAVSYMIVASRFDEIKPLEKCFPFVGCFPYLGFFSEESANSYQAELNKGPYVTYKRPIHAYSTLGHFEDTILSSFFIYDDRELAELIFHELFHTIFFIKSSVEINENLATLFSKELVKLYFKIDKSDKVNLLEDKVDLVREKVTILIKDFATELSLNRPLTKEDGMKRVDDFKIKILLPTINQECRLRGIEGSDCYFTRKVWNQASMTEFLTYSSKLNHFKVIKERTNLSLVDYYYYLKSEFELFKSKSELNERYTDFIAYLLDTTSQRVKIE